jgi:hypothetical protein
MVVNRWWRGVGARVVLELTIVVASYGAFGAPPEGLKAKRTRKWINKGPFTDTRVIKRAERTWQRASGQVRT